MAKVNQEVDSLTTDVKINKLRETFKGKFNSKELAVLLKYHQGDPKKVLNYVFQHRFGEISALLARELGDISDRPGLDPDTLKEAVQGKLKTVCRMFACQECDFFWWRRVPERKQVSKCNRCNTKYDAIPKDKEWGLTQLTCGGCHDQFKKFVEQQTSIECRRCHFTISITNPQIIPPQPRPKWQRFQGYRRHKVRETPNVLYASNVHYSSGSTVDTFLDQEDLLKEIESLETIEEYDESERHPDFLAMKDPGSVQKGKTTLVKNGPTSPKIQGGVSPNKEGASPKAEPIPSPEQEENEEDMLESDQETVTGPVHEVFFDLETTGFGPKAHITQIGAVCGERVYRQYVMPLKPLTPDAAEKTGIQVQDGVMYHHSHKVEPLSLFEAMVGFINFLHESQPALLISHNCKGFDARVLLNSAKAVNLSSRLKECVAGFLDTLILFRKEHEAPDNYRQATLVKHFVGEDYNAHDAVVDAKMLAKLCRKVYPDGLPLSYSFTIAHIERKMEESECRKRHKMRNEQ